MDNEDEDEDESLKPGAAFFPTLPFPSGKAAECLRFSAPEAELWPLG